MNDLEFGKNFFPLRLGTFEKEYRNISSQQETKRIIRGSQNADDHS